VLKPVVQLAAVGVVGAFVAKFLWMLLLPVIGVFLGVLALVFKVALIFGLIWLALKLFNRLTERPSEG